MAVPRNCASMEAIGRNYKIPCCLYMAVKQEHSVNGWSEHVLLTSLSFRMMLPLDKPILN